MVGNNLFGAMLWWEVTVVFDMRFSILDSRFSILDS